MPVDLSNPPSAGLGLVLSSGAARGAAHVGVLQVLEEAGVPVPVVVGASAGALIGAGWAAGIGADEIAAQVSRATWADFGTTRPSRRLGLLDVSVLRAGLDEVLGGRRIEEFPRRFGAVATDVVGRTAVLLDHGSATDAVCATIAVPAIFPMMRLDGRVLVDGALTSPLPVWAARRLGADTMLAIRLRPESSQRSQPLRARVVAPIPDDGPADLELLIDTRDYSGWSARDVAALIDVGRRAAEKSLDQILDLLTPAARPGLASAGCHALPAAESQRHAAVAAGSSR